MQILLPMISNLDELQRARSLLEEAKYELRAEGRSFAEDCKLGIMVEVPSMALMADRFASEVDLLSLGTIPVVVIRVKPKLNLALAPRVPIVHAFGPAHRLVVEDALLDQTRHVRRVERALQSERGSDNVHVGRTR